MSHFIGKDSGSFSSNSKVSLVPQAKSVNQTVDKSNLKPLPEKSSSTTSTSLLPATVSSIPSDPDVTARELMNWTDLDNTTPVSSLAITTSTRRMNDDGSVSSSSLPNDPPPRVDAKCHETKDDRIIRSICRFNYLQKGTKRKVLLHLQRTWSAKRGNRNMQYANMVRAEP